VKPLSVIVTNASRAILPQLPHQPAEMLHLPPLANEQKAVSLLREFGLQPKYTHAGGSLTATGITLTPAPETNWQQCGLIVAGLMAPAPEELLLQWLSTMGVLVAKKDQGETISELELIAYARKLRAWPGDVVRDVLDRYPDENKWWPEWATLRKHLAAASSERLALFGAFRRWAEAPEFMAMREGMAKPGEMVKRIETTPAERAVPAALETPPEMTPEERDRKLKAMKAAILRGGSDG